MAHHEEKLPWELIEEILSRVSPRSLVRMRIVCKRWKALLDNKRFINNHKSTLRFILTTKSKFYSVSIDPKIVVHELALDISDFEESQLPKNLVNCNKFLLCGMDHGSMVWNPWMNQTTWIKPYLEGTDTQFYGVGHDNKNNYKIFSSCLWKGNRTWLLYKLYDFASDAWKYKTSPSDHSSSPSDCRVSFINNASVSLNGILYWVASFAKPNDNNSLFIIGLDCSSEILTRYCYLPCGKNHLHDALFLGVFKGDQFSLLKQCHATKMIEVWVTKNKINNNHCFGEDVVWTKLMEVSGPNLPGLVHIGSYFHQPSYFVEDERLVVCSCDETGRPWIYVVKGNMVILKTQLRSLVDPWPLHCTYVPSLVSIPSFQKRKVELQSLNF